MNQVPLMLICYLSWEGPKVLRQRMNQEQHERWDCKKGRKAVPDVLTFQIHANRFFWRRLMNPCLIIGYLRFHWYGLKKDRNQEHEKQGLSWWGTCQWDMSSYDIWEWMSKNNDNRKKSIKLERWRIDQAIHTNVRKEDEHEMDKYERVNSIWDDQTSRRVCVVLPRMTSPEGARLGPFCFFGSWRKH